MMKKIISLLTVALMAVCFAACTKDTATLRGLIGQENSKCPMNLGSAGEVLSIGYDDENRLVQITVHVNDDTRDLESIREDTQLACRICVLTLPGKKAREFMREIVDTGSDVEITYRSRNSDKSVVAVLSHSDLGDYVDNQQDTVDDSLDEVDSAVKAMQGSIPYEIDEGITITSLTKKGNNVIINCTLDEDICEIQNFRMISDDVKNGFRGNYKDPDMQKLIRALGPTGRGLVINFTGSASGQTIDIFFTPAELF